MSHHSCFSGIFFVNTTQKNRPGKPFLGGLFLFYSLQSSSRAHSAAPRFQTATALRWAAVWARRCVAAIFYTEKISILTVPPTWERIALHPKARSMTGLFSYHSVIPPSPQKGTLGSPARPKAPSRRLAVATTLLRGLGS